MGVHFNLRNGFCKFCSSRRLPSVEKKKNPVAKNISGRKQRWRAVGSTKLGDILRTNVTPTFTPAAYASAVHHVGFQRADYFCNGWAKCQPFSSKIHQKHLLIISVLVSGTIHIFYTLFHICDTVEINVLSPWFVSFNSSCKWLKLKLEPGIAPVITMDHRPRCDRNIFGH